MESVSQAGAERAPGMSNVVGPAIPLDEVIALAHSIGQAAEHAASGTAHARVVSRHEPDRVPSSASRPVSQDELTPCELQVLRLVAAGHSNREIANELILSVRTVERHINNLYAKVGARGKADATAYAFRHGLT